MPGVVFHGVGKVWDAARNRVLCHFTDGGTYETSDPREVEILSGLGYKHDTRIDSVKQALGRLSSAMSEEIADEPEEAVTGEPAKRPRGRPRNA